MALEVKRQERETTQGLIHRFTRKIRQSGILLRARKIKYKEKPSSRQAKKRAALRREELKKKYEKLRKLGKLETEK